MPYKRILNTDPTFKPKPREHWYTVTDERSVSGAFFAVEMWRNPEMGGFPEPFNTGLGRYADQKQAAEEAVILADEYGLPCVLSRELWQYLFDNRLINDLPDAMKGPSA